MNTIPTLYQSKYIAKNYMYKNGSIIRISNGKIVGFKNHDGYLIVEILRESLIHRRAIRAHCIVWFLCKRVWPRKMLDHKDTRYDNNKIRNLREASSVEQGRNRKKFTWKKGGKGTSSFKGVAVSKLKDGTKRYVAYIVNGKRTNLGTFNNEIIAAKAYNKAVIKIYGKFANLNKV